VTKEVDAVCAAYASARKLQFDEPDPGLGIARTATLASSRFVRVRAPMREAEEPMVRPYWLVDDIETAMIAASGSCSRLPARAAAA
jgi:uncharacterized protein